MGEEYEARPEVQVMNSGTLLDEAYSLLRKLIWHFTIVPIFFSMAFHIIRIPSCIGNCVYGQIAYSVLYHSRQ